MHAKTNKKRSRPHPICRGVGSPFNLNYFTRHISIPLHPSVLPIKKKVYHITSTTKADQSMANLAYRLQIFISGQVILMIHKLNRVPILLVRQKKKQKTKTPRKVLITNIKLIYEIDEQKIRYCDFSGFLLFRWGCGKENPEDPSSQYCSNEGADPVDIKLLPCVVPVVDICPTKGLKRQYMIKVRTSHKAFIKIEIIILVQEKLFVFISTPTPFFLSPAFHFASRLCFHCQKIL